ncbi:glyoxalase [Mesobacillus campisalis]|uniref:Glyoxalase n=1 Tax=Mesobacillus campisalis TaxID=1408103 RepID=A0A0M2T382_9BACI|nr:VOC family protein [Mesobacillus campisalis]KKK39270.1 glyoxalase [Mesobacillus campisalis]
MTFHQYPNTYVSQVHLLVQDVKRSTKFYQEIIGFRILSQNERQAVLTADGKTPLLVVEQPEGAAPKQPRTTGLYHFALLLPSRADLGSALLHLLQTQYPLQGASDHLVSEAIYLADPDGNGIEIYADTPAESWTWNSGQVEMATKPLNAEELLAIGNGTPWNGLPEETIMGHIHLHVAELQEIEQFYCDGLGFDVVLKYGPQALFISTGGYHHHIGLNTWNGPGAPSPKENASGLKTFTLAFPKEEKENITGRLRKLAAQVNEIEGALLTQDPSGNKIKLVFS